MSQSALVLRALAILSFVVSLGPRGAAQLELRQGDRICLIGNAFAERMQHHGWFEARLQAAFPELELTVRNLGFSADELTVRQRTAGFGTQDEWLTRCEADVIIACYGFNESFSGEEGLPEFRSDLERFIEHTRAQRYNGESAPRLVLVEPIAFDQKDDSTRLGPGLNSPGLYGVQREMAEVAARCGVPLIAARAASKRLYSANPDQLTINGIHLTDRGNELLSRTLFEGITGVPAPEEDPARLEAIRTAVLEKNLYWFNRYRATDGYNVYGGRSSLAYENDQTNYEVLQQELVVLDAMTDRMDRVIHAIARGEEIPADLPPIPDQIPVPTNRPGPGPDGAYEFESGEGAIASMTLPEGMAVNLFADEQQFPELANPVQMAWDTRGRLWVAAWRTYPHWKPGEPMDDKLLILEDTDGDGRADVCKTFAGDLHNPTGFEFWNGGVIVANAPDLLFLKDTDGDDVADTRERILHGLSSADTHHAANSFVLGPDGALYFQEGTFHMSQVESIYGPVRNTNSCVWRFHPRTWRVERYIPYDFANPHGHVFDRWGQDFVTDGTGNVNYWALPFTGHLDAPQKHSGYFPFFRQRSRPAAATEIISGTHFPEENRGNYLIANVIGFQGIFQYELADDGSGFSAEEVTPLVQSTDPNFRPVDIEVGPDGAVYFLDWQNPLIGHMQHHLRDPSRDQSHGRVYRISCPDRPLQAVVSLPELSTPEVVARLKHESDRERYRARIELSGRDTDEVVAAARDFAAHVETTEPEFEHHLLEALWLQVQHDVLDHALLVRLLHADDPRARAAATRVLRNMRQKYGASDPLTRGERGKHRASEPLTMLEHLLADEALRVQLEAIVALSFFDDPRAAELALRFQGRFMVDRFQQYALKETLTALERTMREALRADATWARAAPDRKTFAQDDPAGLAYALSLLSDSELDQVLPSEQRYAEQLARCGHSSEEYLGFAQELGALRGQSPARALGGAIRRADHGDHGHTDHLLTELFKVIPLLPESDTDELAFLMQDLAKHAQRASTRRLATAAQIVATGSVDAAWQEASQSIDKLTDLVEAVPWLQDDELAAQLQPRVTALLNGPPQALRSTAPQVDRTVGRFVRVDLPDVVGTLTLAEVEVFSGGTNVAREGTATQSSEAWGGVASRGIDGITSGFWADGGQTHTVEDQPDTWWEVDLGAEHPIDAIALWNRLDNDGQFLSRLDHCLVRVLDAERRTTFEWQAGEMREARTRVELSSPSLRLRRAAARNLPALDAQHDASIRALLAHYDDDELRGAVVTGLASVPPFEWAEDARAAVAERLVRYFDSAPDAEFETVAGRASLSLADDLIDALPEAEALELYAARRGRGPQVVVIRPRPDTLLYDRDEFTVAAGRPVELVFSNVDIMPHNLVITSPGALVKVGTAAEAMASRDDAWDLGFVPELDEVLHATGLQQPGESFTLRFTAPAEVGDYPYVCTFPGHWIRMNGTMRVVAELDEPTALPIDGGVESETAAPTRAFVKNWMPADFDGMEGQLTRASAERGRAVFEAASCLSCHTVGDEGGKTGPTLVEVVGKYAPEDLLTQILEPSRVILEGYESEVFRTVDGEIIAGQPVEEDGENVYVRDDPYRDDTLILPLAEIEERRVSSVSTMPTGLLSTFTRAEIVDLVAYLRSLASAK
ncbi:MAG: c-type cytochrome [Planctomycetes bacterium]|nr:c-type cytochrome [Planctomycetota bacterium]